MADPFATTTDLEARWRPLSVEETTRATTLLVDASATIRARCPGIDQRIEDELLDALIVTRVACAMTQRILATSTEHAGVTQVQEGTGPFSQSFQVANPMGNLYLTNAERLDLGYGKQKAGTVEPYIDTDTATVDPWGDPL